MRQTSQRLACAVRLRQSGQLCWACGVVTQAQDGRFSKRPRQRGVAHLGAGGPGALAGGFPGALDHATIGDDLLHAGKTPDIMDFIEPYATPDRADARDGTQPVKSLGIVLRGGLHHGPCDVAQEAIGDVDQREIDREALLHGGLGEAFGHASAVSCVAEVCADLRQVLWMVHMLDVGQEVRPCARQRHPTPQGVPSGPHRCWRQIGLRKHPAAQQASDVVHIERIVFGLATMAGCHGEGLTKDEGKALTAVQVGQPRPGEASMRRQPPHPHERARGP
jgi:hypothetical protein